MLKIPQSQNLALGSSKMEKILNLAHSHNIEKKNIFKKYEEDKCQKDNFFKQKKILVCPVIRFKSREFHQRC